MAKRKPIDCIEVNATLPTLTVSLWHDQAELGKRLCERGIPADFLKSDAQTFAAELDGEPVNFVLFECEGDVPLHEQLALLAHEAVHVTDSFFERIGEEEAGNETYAYVVQAACSALFDAHLAWIGKQEGKKNEEK